MKLAVMQPYLFPYIGYYQLMNAVDKFVVYDDVSFIKQGWINRNNILLGGKKFMFIVPVKSISSFRNIAETEIDHSRNWQKKILLTFEQAYKKAPYYQLMQPVLTAVFGAQVKYVSEMATLSLEEICKVLSIKTALKKSSSDYGNQELKGQERVLDICRREGAHEYINPIGGTELYSKEKFKENEITLGFLKTGDIKYDQPAPEFVPYLSIIDVLMFNSPEQVKPMLGQYEIV
jgi:hypothetical protein